MAVDNRVSVSGAPGRNPQSADLSQAFDGLELFFYFIFCSRTVCEDPGGGFMRVLCR